jgi:transcriptional regulator with XRE-family HTH domain
MVDRPLTREHLRSRRLALGLLQADLAVLLGVSHDTVSHWERGSRPFPALLDLALEALEWRVLASHETPEDIARRIIRALAPRSQSP